MKHAHEQLSRVSAQPVTVTDIGNVAKILLDALITSIESGRTCPLCGQKSNPDEPDSSL